jgi:hypothetical protein
MNTENKEEKLDGANLPAKLNLPPEQLTEAAIKSFFQIEINRKDYQQVLQGIDAIVPTKENLVESNTKINAAENVCKQLNEFATETGSPYHKTHKLILKVMKEFLEPILTKVASKKAEIKTKNDELLADLAAQAAEQARIDNIKTTMTTFINNCTQFITLATTGKQIVNIQKRIGTEKSKKSFYAEFYDELVAKCDALTPLINERKEYIRKQDELSAAAETALKNDDAEAAAEIKEQQEQLESDMEENVLRLQEEAFNQISSDIPVIVAEPTGEALSGRNYWRWEILDAKKAFKKHEDWINLEPNKEVLDKFMAENREQWKKDGKTEFVLDGIKFFIKKYL